MKWYVLLSSATVCYNMKKFSFKSLALVMWEEKKQCLLMPDDLDALYRYFRNMHRVIPASLNDWITDQSRNTIPVSEENIYLLITLSYMKSYVCQCSLHSKSHSSHHSSAIMCSNIKQTSFASMVQASWETTMSIHATWYGCD